jgi:hypothetical protein
MLGRKGIANKYRHFLSLVSKPETPTKGIFS